MILVAGGTGLLGRQLVPLLVRRGQAVRVLARDPDRAAGALPPGVDLVAADVRDRSVTEHALTGATTVISAVQGFGGPNALGPAAVDRDGNLALVAAAEASGVRRFVLVSIAGASADHPIELFRMKHAAEERLRASGLDWVIVRPSAYMETWFELVGRPLVETGRTRVFGRGLNPVNFVSVRDVARVVDVVATDGERRRVTISVPGPENLSFERFAAIVSEASGPRARVDHVPRAMLRGLSAVLRPVRPVLAGQMHAALVMDTRPMTADPATRAAAFPDIPFTSLAEVVADLLAAPDVPVPGPGADASRRRAVDLRRP